MQRLGTVISFTEPLHEITDTNLGLGMYPTLTYNVNC